MSTTVESVQQLLESEDFGDRLRAVNQIRQLEPALGFELLLAATADSNARVRYAAVSQMSSLGEQDLERTLPVLRSCLLRDAEVDVQAAAADAIGALRLRQVYGDLAETYHRTSEWLLKFSIIAALGELGEPAAFDLLAEALKSDNELVQMAAIGSLGELGDDRAISLLTPFATHADWQVRYRVVLALRQFQGVEVATALAELSHDVSEAVAREATAAISQY